MYNRTLAAIEKWEREGRIFVIRPQMKAIGRLESDPRLLEAFYRDGYEQICRQYEALQTYLQKSRNKEEKTFSHDVRYILSGRDLFVCL